MFIMADLSMKSDPTKSPVVQLLAELVRISSVNPNYADGVPERQAAEFIEGYLAQNGIESWRQEIFPDRFNVLARIPGCHSDRRIVFEAHIDTVSALGMSIAAFSPQIEGGRLYGRGACDTKAGLAAMLTALVSLKRDQITPPGEILLAATIDEEFSYRGVLALCEGLESRKLGDTPAGKPLQARLAVVAEPTELRLVTASKGVLRWKVETIGRAAHSSKPELGQNAIVAMARLIQALELDAQRLCQQRHPLLGSPTLNIGVIQGGVQVNLVPDRCTIEIDRRLIPPESWQAVYRDYAKLIDELMTTEATVRIQMQPPMLTDLPLEVSQDAAVLNRLSEILHSMNLDGGQIGVPFGSDASKLAAVGIPSVILGPGSIDQAHTADEFVDCQQVVNAVELYRRIMLSEW
jgi:acetylornithine deacetylase/succinyl-diaminopimelate desuccinylase family protein